MPADGADTVRVAVPLPVKVDGLMLAVAPPPTVAVNVTVFLNWLFVPTVTVVVEGTPRCRLIDEGALMVKSAEGAGPGNDVMYT